MRESDTRGCGIRVYRQTSLNSGGLESASDQRFCNGVAIAHAGIIHVAPVTGRVPDGQEDWCITALGFRERFGSANAEPSWRPRIQALTWDVENTYLLPADRTDPHRRATMPMNTNDVPFHACHDDELLTLDEVAQILMASSNTLRWWRQIGTGPEFFMIGRRLYTTVGELRRFIREQRLASRPVIPAPKVG